MKDRNDVRDGEVVLYEGEYCDSYELYKKHIASDSVAERKNIRKAFTAQFEYFIVKTAVKEAKRWNAFNNYLHEIELSEAIQEGALGFMHAFDQFDPSLYKQEDLETRFNRLLCIYSRMWIRQHIQRYQEKMATTIRVPADKFNQFINGQDSELIVRNAFFSNGRSINSLSIDGKDKMLDSILFKSDGCVEHPYDSSEKAKETSLQQAKEVLQKIDVHDLIYGFGTSKKILKELGLLHSDCKRCSRGTKGSSVTKILEARERIFSALRENGINEEIFEDF